MQVVELALHSANPVQWPTVFPYHLGNICPLFVDARWTVYVVICRMANFGGEFVERPSYGVQEQFVLGEALPGFHYEVDQLQSIALFLHFGPLRMRGRDISSSSFTKYVYIRHKLLHKFTTNVCDIS